MAGAEQVFGYVTDIIDAEEAVGDVDDDHENNDDDNHGG